MKQKIDGSVVYDAENKRFTFMPQWGENMFTNGAYTDHGFNFILVHTNGVDIEVPDGFDTVKPQLENLDRRESELTIQYNQALQHIKVQRNNLLAITNE